MDNAVDVHMYNNLKFLIEYLARPTKVVGSTSDGILQGYGTVKIRLVKKDGSKKVILNFQNVFYLLNSLLNLISLGLLNDTNIYHVNKNQILYDKISQKPLAFT